LPGDVIHRSRILIAIAAKQSDTNRLTDALNTVALVEDGKWKAAALSEVAQSLARRKQFNLATNLLRHSRATMLDSVGTPIGTMQSLLGHSTADISREIYLHAVPEEQRRAVESVERLVFGSKWTQVQAPTQTTSGKVN
jgi:site-specific recombinase XerD